MNDVQLLERLSSAYTSLPAPRPSPELAALLDEGAVGTDDDRGAVVIPLTRPRARVRYLVAAMVASFVAFSGLAVAGALPDPVQRQVSSLVSQVGIHVPHPDPGPGANRAPGVGSDGGNPRSPAADHAPTSTAPKPVPRSAGAAGGADATPGASTPAPAPATNAPPSDSLGDIGGAVADPGVPPTTPPPPSNTLLPPITVPQLTLPPITVPQLTLPPLTLPPLPLPLPPLLPLLGL